MNVVLQQNKILKEFMYDNLSIQIDREEQMYKCLNSFFSKVYELDKAIDHIESINDLRSVDKGIRECCEIYDKAGTDYAENYANVFRDRYIELKMEMEKKIDRLRVKQSDLKLLHSNYLLHMRKIRFNDEYSYNSVDYEIKTIVERFNAKKIEVTTKLKEEYEEREKSQFKLLSTKTVPKNSKIYDYKDMIRLAEENGFMYVRTSGDHLIYRNYNTCKMTVIPAHRLGYGLMKKIQKQILNNK